MANEIIKTMNKKGSMTPRNIIFSVIIFATIISLGSLLVTNMAAEYENDEMSSDYSAEGGVGGLGNSMIGDIDNSLYSMSDNLDETAGTFGAITGSIKGIGSILKLIILSPIYIGTALTTIMDALNIPSGIATIIKTMLMLLVITVIVFVIISATSRGGTKI